jgi:hypothetical protein
MSSNPLTTATSLGVAIRYIATIAVSMITILGILNLLTTQQVDDLSKSVPDLVTAITALLTVLIPLYATIFKSSSDKAASAAKEIDKKIPAGAPVEIVTPGAAPNIVIPAAPPNG